MKLGNRSRQRGAVMVMVALWLPVMAIFGSFAIDAGHFWDFSRNLQNRADAAAWAGGDQLGNICAGNPTSATTAPENVIGQMAQLFSGPPGSSSDLPYPYSGTGSPLAAFPTISGYQNVPNLAASNGGNGTNYHVFLNADNYASAGGSNFAIGDFCHGNPTLDRTDSECFGQTNLTGQLANDCAAGPMVDVKVTQSNVPMFFGFLGFSPNISAHARAVAQGIGVANNLKPLGVEDAGVVPCVRVQFVPTTGSTATQTVQLAVNSGATTSTGPIIWDNSSDNGGTGDAITVPNGANLYMKATLYAPGSSGTCSTLGSPLNYESNSGILMLNSYGTTAPTATQAPVLIGNGNGGGVTLIDNTCSHDQYFSNNTGSCTVTACVIAAFTPGATNQAVTINGQTITTQSTDPFCSTKVAGATAWESTPFTITSASGQTQFTVGWKEKLRAVCGNGSTCSQSFGVEQQAFSACNENFNSSCGGDPNISGPIIRAYLTDTGTGLQNVGSYQGNTTHHLIITLALQGLQDSPRSDRCANGPSQCTLLRVDQGNADGMVDCGQGNGASGARSVMLYGCPLYGEPGSDPNGGCVAAASNYCGPWEPVPAGTPDGVCNYAGRTATTAVDCVNTNNDGAQIPLCIQALVVSAGGNNGVVDPGTIDSNCHVSGSTCSEDKWLTGSPIDPTNGTADPRLIQTFILFQGDIAGATGNHDMQIRTFASFYVTGWQIHSNGLQVNCTGVGANEPPPSTLPNNADAIWGHWITYTELGAGGNGKPCNFNAFGDCAVVLTR